MDITIISDTHGLHNQLQLSEGMVLVHTGDITEYGTEEEVIEFLDWFSRQPFSYKIFIGGNHDLFLESSTKAEKRKLIPSNTIYLQNSGTEIHGFRFWGSPFTPWLLGMAFNARAGNEIQRVWRKIPSAIDVLITHGPPKGILDAGMGDDGLNLRVGKIKPKVHCFGHIHGHAGSESQDGITYINAAMVDSPDPLSTIDYRINGKPIIYSL